MSSDKETADYIELRPGDKVQVWDQWLDQFGQWQFYTHTVGTEGLVGDGVRARRPIRTSCQTAYEEVPGSRTTQDAVSQPQRERIAYEELQPGTEVQAGDQYRNTQGRWVEYSMNTSGVPIVGPTAMARRPHNITMMLAEFGNQAEVLAEVRADEERLVSRLELLRSEYAKLQDERDKLRAEMDIVKGDRMNLREALAAERAAHRVTVEQGLQACKERDEALAELAQVREASQQLLQTITDNADQFADAGKILEQQRDEARAELGVALTRVIALEHNLAETKKDAARIAQEYAEWSKESEAASSQLQQERDEARAERDRLQGVVDNLYNEPTARQVQEMLRTWATELDWSAGCFDSAGRDEIDTIQKTLVAVIERIESIINPEGGTDGE